MAVVCGEGAEQRVLNVHYISIIALYFYNYVKKHVVIVFSFYGMMFRARMPELLIQYNLYGRIMEYYKRP